MLKRTVWTLFCMACLSSAAAEKIAVINAWLIDGVSDGALDQMTVLISEGKIESIRKNGYVPSGYETVDISGGTLLPGFIDAHTHVRSLSSARRALESGVTTLRSASTPNFQDVGIRQLVKSGAVKPLLKI